MTLMNHWMYSKYNTPKTNKSTFSAQDPWSIVELQLSLKVQSSDLNDLYVVLDWVIN